MLCIYFIVLLFGAYLPRISVSFQEEMRKQSKMNKIPQAMNSFNTSPANIPRLVGYIQYVICQAFAFCDQQFLVNHLFKSFSRPVVILVSQLILSYVNKILLT